MNVDAKFGKKSFRPLSYFYFLVKNYKGERRPSRLIEVFQD